MASPAFPHKLLLGGRDDLLEHIHAVRGAKSHKWDPVKRQSLGPVDADEELQGPPMTIHVHVMEPDLFHRTALHCPRGPDDLHTTSFHFTVGAGKQSFRWLVLAIAQRFQQQRAPGGRVRQREQHDRGKGEHLIPSGAALKAAMAACSLKDRRNDAPPKLKVRLCECMCMCVGVVAEGCVVCEGGGTSLF
jgi:hypothetical protein